MQQGKLFLVATPIGNLSEITFRAVEVLKTVDCILAEDTRTSSVLLKHYQINTKCISFHAHNEHFKLSQIIDEINNGKTFAQISDAGTPGISDPGFLLARACLEQEITVEIIGINTAFIPALLKSGFPIHRFSFEGFLPLKKGRQTRLEELKNENRSMVFYESPHRLIKTLQQFITIFGAERRVSVSREISKKFEETITGNLDFVAAHFEKNAPKGEFVIVIESKNAKHTEE